MKPKKEFEEVAMATKSIKEIFSDCIGSREPYSWIAFKQSKSMTLFIEEIKDFPPEEVWEFLEERISKKQKQFRNLMAKIRDKEYVVKRSDELHNESITKVMNYYKSLNDHTSP